MKKVLLASTVLAMTATVAAAEVKITGDARMGVTNVFVHGAGLDETGFSSRARVAFTMSGETDGGLAFGASLRADNAAGAAAGTAGSVFISGAFGKLSLGDVDGAAQSAVGQVDGIGYTGVGDANEITYLATNAPGLGLPAVPGAAAGDPTALYEFSTAGFTVYASVSQPTTKSVLARPVTVPPTPPLPADGTYDVDAYAVGAAYSMDAYKFSLGYEGYSSERVIVAAGAVAGPINHKAKQWVLGADATFGQIAVKARYAKAESSTNGVALQKRTQSAVSATYKMDALSVTGFVSNSNTKTPAGVNVMKVSSFGIGAGYDLGGGASIKGGIASQKQTAGAPAVVTKDTAFDLGVTFSF